LRQISTFFSNGSCGVDHHAGEAFINAFLAQLEGIAVIEVDGDGDVGEADGGLDEFLR
jgi:hypothetical protein